MNAFQGSFSILRLVTVACLVGLLLALGAACGPTTSGSGGGTTTAGGGGGSRHARDPSICPRECFDSDGSCVSLPSEMPERDRGDQISEVETAPCDPRCCEG